ncbi:MAG TPA: hypothetical protein VNX26_11630 [Candidatus Acidoferrum sp.]|jgi:hypothetical protein|nr:hypothetical protein [Candidatus Acidoferrum sp.]
MRIARCLALLVLLFTLCCTPSTKTNPYYPVLTQHVDEKRSGVQLETVLSTTNVNAGTFGKVLTWTLPVSQYSTPGLKDRVYGQPLFVNKGVNHNLVIVATDTNMVYAFDAQDDGKSTPVWGAPLGPPESAIDNWTDPHCNRSLPVIGVLSTPVIDPIYQQFLYVVSKNRNTSNKASHDVSFTIHKIEVATGIEKASLPIGQNVNGFNPYYQTQRAGLVFIATVGQPSGFVYATFGAHCDGGSWHGWIFGFDSDLKTQVVARNTTPDGVGGGIWQAGQAPAVALATNTKENTMFYVSTGNGSGQLVNSVLKYQWSAGDGSLTPVDSFTPYNNAALNLCDADIASTGPVLLDGGNGLKGMLVTGGKEGILYVLSTANLHNAAAPEGTPSGDICQHNNGGGGLNTSYSWSPKDTVVQEFQAVSKFNDPMLDPPGGQWVFGHIHGAPVYTTLADGSLRLYMWPEMDYLKQFKWVNGKFQTNPESQSTGPMIPGMPGGMLSISTSSPSQTGGDVIVWATHPKTDAWAPPPANPSNQSIPTPIDGVLYAFNASDVSKNLWNSDMKPGDKLGEFSKFAPPTIANGRVYVATFSGQVQVYGLCGAPSICK